MGRIFKVTAEGDQMFFGASDLESAKTRFKEIMGDVPESLLTWEEVDELPEGETLM